MISINAYAKVNLSLVINKKREDGYHIIDTVMQSVSLYVVVTITSAEKGLIEVSCDFCGLSGENNLCYKAATMFFEKSKINSGCRISIEKNIPVAAGLGGGSSDAAAVLKGLNSLFGNPLSIGELEDMSLTLGADVPFLIEGGSARAKGIGEKLAKFENCLKLNFLLIKDGEKPSTAQMYKAFDELEVKSLDRAASADCEMALKNGDMGLFLKSFNNDFSYVWNYENIKSDLLNVNALSVSLSGSGPTVMGVFKNSIEAQKAYEVLKDKYAFVCCAQTVNE